MTAATATRPRRRMEVMRDLDTERRERNRLERRVMDSASREEADRCERLIRSVTLHIERLELELTTAPEDAPAALANHRDCGGSIRIGSRDVNAEPFTAAEIAALEIPTFLRRQ